MGDTYYKVAFSPKFSSTFKLMGGIFVARSPNQFYGIKTFIAGNLNWWKVGAKSTKFTFLTGASFEYRLYQQV